MHRHMTVFEVEIEILYCHSDDFLFLAEAIVLRNSQAAFILVSIIIFWIKVELL